MANVLYDSAKEAFLSGDIDLTTDDIRVILVDLADYTFSALHDFLDDVPAGAREEVSAALGSKTVTNGVFDSANTVFTAAAGDESEALILYKHTGVEATSNLIAFYDTGVGNMPIILNGSNVDVTVHASGWFAL